MTFWELLTSGWTLLIIGLDLVCAAWAASHAILTNRDPRSVILWVWFVSLVPILGPFLYLIFGVNRIRRAGSRIRKSYPSYPIHSAECPTPPCADPADILEDRFHYLVPISAVIGKLATEPVTAGNHIEILENGDEAYPAMLEAIGQASKSVAFSSYIFEWTGIGERFAEALVRAQNRGVAVRVIIDDFGTRYSWPSAVKHLAKRGISVRRFMPKRHLLRLLTLNLRNHRKLLVTDGTTGFTGGLNIRLGHLLNDNPKYPVQDVHFRLRGPIVRQLQEVFAEDWAFCDGETLSGPDWFPDLQYAGNTLSQGIAEGPDLEIDATFHTILAALSTARESVQIVTPYFLPSTPIVAALNIAALRGIDVQIVLPEINNIPLVRWASRAGYLELLEHGCRIYESAPPFDHTKIFIVDRTWSLVGSTNWDPRSLHLNFEFNVANFDPDLATRLSAIVARRIATAKPITPDQMRSRPLPTRLRDGIARIFTPAL